MWVRLARELDDGATDTRQRNLRGGLLRKGVLERFEHYAGPADECVASAMLCISVRLRVAA